MINKRCVDCGKCKILWTSEHESVIGCKLGRWTLRPGDNIFQLRKYNKKAESCLEFRFTLTE